MQSGSGLFGNVSVYVDLKDLKISAASSRWVLISVSLIGTMIEGWIPSMKNSKCSS